MIPDNIDNIICRMKLREDRAFVRSRLNRLRTEMMTNIFKEYLRIWREAMEAEPVSFRKENAGRLKANRYLLNYEPKNTRAW